MLVKTNQFRLLCINVVTHVQKVILSWVGSREVDDGNSLYRRQKGLLKLVKQRLVGNIIVVSMREKKVCQLVTNK